jgi:hypothetical protein
MNNSKYTKTRIATRHETFLPQKKYSKFVNYHQISKDLFAIQINK